MEVGEIDKLFVYDEKEFAIIVKFISSDHVYGLQHAEKTVQTRLIAQVKDISKPLAIAKCSESDLWILNYKH